MSRGLPLHSQPVQSGRTQTIQADGGEKDLHTRGRNLRDILGGDERYFLSVAKSPNLNLE